LPFLARIDVQDTERARRSDHGPKLFRRTPRNNAGNRAGARRAACCSA
jgi:hypothetical protein